MSIMNLFKNIFSKPTTSRTTEKVKRQPSKQYIKKEDDNSKSLRKGEIGEYKIDIQLEQLPKECKFISDLLIPNSKSSSGYSQIDHVVITPYGILVIETKNYQGKITVKREEKNWLVNGKPALYNPLWQNYGHIQTLKAILNDEKIQFYSIISFTGRCTLEFDLEIELELRKKPSNGLIIYDTQLSIRINEIITKLKFENKIVLTDSDISKIHKAIKQAHIDDPKIRQEHIEKAKQNREVNFHNKKCATCGKSISDKVAKFCLVNKTKYKGKVYCIEHQ